MRKNFRTVLAAGAVLAGFAAASGLYAHAADSQGSRSQGGMMGGMMQGGQGDMMGMMNMMQQMNQMMESCNAMMKDMQPQRGRESPQDQKKPAQKG